MTKSPPINLREGRLWEETIGSCGKMLKNVNFAAEDKIYRCMKPRIKQK